MAVIERRRRPAAQRLHQLGLILAPNILCIAGVFTLGFGNFASVLTNNVAALGALLNGMRPMRKVAAYEAERRHLLELQLRQSGFFDAAEEAFAEEARGTARPSARCRSS